MQAQQASRRSPPRAADVRCATPDRTAHTPLPRRLCGTAAGSATRRHRIRKLAELRHAVVCFGQLLGDGLDLRYDFAQKIEEQRSSVKKMFDVQERGFHAEFLHASLARAKRPIAVLFQPRLQQLVLDRHSA